ELHEFEEFLKEHLDSCEDEYECFIAFLCLATFLRRNEHKSRLKGIYEKDGHRFKHHPLYSHFKAMMHTMNHEYLESMRVTRELMEKYPEMGKNSGVLHLYAEAIIAYLEDMKGNNQMLSTRE